MGRLLESLDALEPLAALVALTPDPSITGEQIYDLVDRGDGTTLIDLFGDKVLATAALKHAGIIDDRYQLISGARDQAIRLQTLVALQARTTDSWSPVMTIPAYLREATTAVAISETAVVLRRMVGLAQRRLIIAAPFLDGGFAVMTPGIERLLRHGGEVLIISRDLTNSHSDNARAINGLRQRCAHPPHLRVASWEEDGLGLHMKTVVVDDQVAYVGSANFTVGGMGLHAELGVRLEGPAVRQISALLRLLADELQRRRRWQAR
jgi:phosphatidylserine/phosphatidylglycerophosphate/cardiolipin synthase-like enzyme